MPMITTPGQVIIFFIQLQFDHALLGLGLLVIRTKIRPWEAKAEDQCNTSCSRENELQNQSAKVLRLL